MNECNFVHQIFNDLKDNFSSHSGEYKLFRPEYPEELYQFIYSIVPTKETAWDCGTGNGQVAAVLAETFQQVFATDISTQQINKAVRKDNIIYLVESAEKTAFHNHYFDLITIAQAIHWFDFDLFYKEAKRVLKPDGIIAVMGYGLLEVNPEVDAVVQHFYSSVIGQYWDSERRYIDEQYKTIPFPFKEIECPTFYYKTEWTLEHLIGYLNTWSAVKHYQKQLNKDPLDEIREELQKAWQKEKLTVSFPQLLRVGKVK
jgi:ubiquinone/menaquinone biosynthesis C-methylase UbiE